MAKVKTKKYTIEFSGTDTDMSLPIEITARQFEAQFDFLQKKVVSTAQDETPMEHRVFHKEYESHTQTTHFFTVGTADTILTKIACKEGFHIK